ncbi:hypothetical protein MRX96_036505 [Rhipicephalus microplus]
MARSPDFAEPGRLTLFISSGVFEASIDLATVESMSAAALFGSFRGPSLAGIWPVFGSLRTVCQLASRGTRQGSRTEGDAYRSHLRRCRQESRCGLFRNSSTPETLFNEDDRAGGRRVGLSLGDNESPRRATGAAVDKTPLEHTWQNGKRPPIRFVESV